MYITGISMLNISDYLLTYRIENIEGHNFCYAKVACVQLKWLACSPNPYAYVNG